MPIYEFICKNCDHAFEVLMSSSSQGTCPKCHSRRLDKQHSVFSATVKEGGPRTSDIPPQCGACPNGPNGAGACSSN
jgi:putative FmdB family regulatory protein